MAEEAGFTRSCSEGTGRLLRVLAATVGSGLAAEIGTGYGVGAAWMLSGLPPTARLFTVESDPDRASRARALFASEGRVRVLQGDWRMLLARGPFRLLFVDARPAKEEDPGTLLQMVAPGGLVVLDDFTPRGRGVSHGNEQDDAMRTSWLSYSGMVVAEVRVSEAEALVVGCKPTG